jgi:hypothetical protein
VALIRGKIIKWADKALVIVACSSPRKDSGMARKPELLSARDIVRASAAAFRKRGIQLAKYVLCPFGLASDNVGDVTVDDKIALIQSHPHSDIYLCPLTGEHQPTESIAWYYADCIAFEHDIPVIVLPNRSDFERFGYRYAVGGPARSKQEYVGRDESGQIIKRTVRAQSAKDAVRNFYTEQLCSIFSEVREIRQGPLTYVLFRHGTSGARLDLPYSNTYSSAIQEVHLYAVALRQADALSEFLCYYRVIESATNSNGVDWVSRALNRLASHNFGRIEIGRMPEPGSRNLVAIWRRRALMRLLILGQQYGSSVDIAKYLYQTNRCGIAHGRRIVRADITPSYFEVVRDTYILKLLARLAIDEKV